MGNESEESGWTEILVDPAASVVAIGDAAPCDARLTQGLRAGDDLLLRFHLEDRDLVRLMLRASPGRAGRAATLALRWASGRDRWSKVTACFRADGTRGVRIGLKRDELAAARHAEEQMRRVVEASAQGIVVRTATEILYMNESFAKLLGYASARECIDTAPHIDAIIHPDDRPLVLERLNARISGQETVSHYDLRLLRKDGSTAWVETHVTFVKWDGQAASLSWLIDISARKKLETELLKSKDDAEFANHAKSEFLANVNHELRTPLTSILGFTQLLNEQPDLSAQSKRFVERVTNASQALLALVNEVLDFSKIESGKIHINLRPMPAVQLARAALELITPQADAKGLRLCFEAADDVPARVLLDADKFCEVLHNLIGNAVKFTDEGVVTLRLSLGAAGSRLRCEVIDSGPGIPPDALGRLFQRFSQIDDSTARMHGGTGLGLAICKGLIEAMGGEIGVTSEQEQGSTFWFELPLRDAESKSAPEIQRTEGERRVG